MIWMICFIINNYYKFITNSLIFPTVFYRDRDIKMGHSISRTILKKHSSRSVSIFHILLLEIFFK